VEKKMTGKMVDGLEVGRREATLLAAGSHLSVAPAFPSPKPSSREVRNELAAA